MEKKGQQSTKAKRKGTKHIGEMKRRHFLYSWMNSHFKSSKFWNVSSVQIFNLKKLKITYLSIFIKTLQ
jgi:hypothetical protein